MIVYALRLDFNVSLEKVEEVSLLLRQAFRCKAVKFSKNQIFLCSELPRDKKATDTLCRIVCRATNEFGDGIIIPIIGGRHYKCGSAREFVYSKAFNSSLDVWIYSVEKGMVRRYAANN